MIKVAIYEDNAKLREGLSILLNGSDDFSIVGAYRNCDRIVDEVLVTQPDVILMDLDMPGTNGIEGLKLIRQQQIDVKVVMLTVFEDSKEILDAILNGANGYLLKKTKPSKLLECIQEVCNGGAPMTPTVASQVIKMFSSMHGPKTSVDYRLSAREKEVLQLLVNGYSYKMIASDMMIAIDTVRSHIKKIYEKLRVNSKSEALSKAFRDRIL